jgi:hypothetical protein
VFKMALGDWEIRGVGKGSINGVRVSGGGG